MKMLIALLIAFSNAMTNPQAYLIGNDDAQSILIYPVNSDQQFNLNMVNSGSGQPPHAYYGMDQNNMSEIPVFEQGGGAPMGGTGGYTGGMDTSQGMVNPNPAMGGQPTMMDTVQPIYEASPEQSAAIAQGEMMPMGSQTPVTGEGMPPSGAATSMNGTPANNSSSTDKSSSSSSNGKSKDSKSKSSSSSKDKKKNGAASVSVLAGLLGVTLCMLLA